MTESGREGRAGSTPSVYYTESFVNCRLEEAWRWMLDYRAWNPDLANAELVRVRGEPDSEGEVVMIRLRDVESNVLAEFYSHTIKLTAPSHVVWYVHSKDGETFRNFVDFGLTQTPAGVKFSICYYAQNLVTAEALPQLRRDTEASLQSLAAVFRTYCASKS